MLAGWLVPFRHLLILAQCTVCAYMEAALVPCWLAGWGHLGICCFWLNARFVPIWRQPWSHVGWLAGAISASADSGSMDGLCLYGGSLAPMLAGWLGPSRHLLMLAQCTVCGYTEAALVPCWLAGAISASAASGSMHGLCLYGGSLAPMLAGWLGPSRHLLILAQWTVCAYMEAALVPHVGWLAGAISASADSGSMHGLCLYGGSLGPMLAGWLGPSRHLLLLAQCTVCAYMEAALVPCWLAGWGHLGIC